jgi:hypothetical protein
MVKELTIQFFMNRLFKTSFSLTAYILLTLGFIIVFNIPLKLIGCNILDTHYTQRFLVFFAIYSDEYGVEVVIGF